MPEASRDAHVRVEKRLSSLMKAAICDDIAQIDRLLAPNTVDDALPAADLNETDEDGWTALHHAASKGSHRALLALLERGARSDLPTRKGATALMLAAKDARGIAVEILLALDGVSDASESQPGNATPPEKSNLYLYQLAAKRYSDMPEPERQEELSSAVVAGKSNMAARMLATGGLDFENPDQRDTTLLGYAVRNGDETMVRLLLCAGAGVNGVNLTDTSPLMHAVLSLQHGIIPVLLHAGASPIQERADGESALTIAVRLDSLPVMCALIADKHSLLANVKRGKRMLTLAVGFKSTSIATELLSRGVDLPNKAGSCALAVSAKKAIRREWHFC